MEKKALKTKVETTMKSCMPKIRDCIVPIPKAERFDIREYEDGNEKTTVTAYGKDNNEFGIYTKTNFIPLSELSYRELEKTLKVIHD